MEQRVSLITPGVRDMVAMGKFYEALGWTRVQTDDGVIAFDLIGQRWASIHWTSWPRTSA